MRGRRPHFRSSIKDDLLATPISRVTPRRDEERHVEMAFRLAHRKAQGNLVKKRRIGCRHLPTGKIGPYAERQFVTADRHGPVINQWLIGSAICIRDRTGHDATYA